jgi:hypothetical protein
MFRILLQEADGQRYTRGPILCTRLASVFASG